MARHVDAIVIGSGLGGLTAAALYARAGRRVLVLERNDTFGGAATVYHHGGLAIEASLHEIDGFDVDDPKLPLLASLGLDRDLDFVDPGDLYEVRGPAIGAPFVLPHGREPAIAALTARFSHQKDRIEDYVERLVAVRQAVTLADRHRDDRAWWLTHAPEAVRRLWPLLREGNATLAEVLQYLFGADESIKFALAANLVYYHDDPNRMLFVRFAIPQASYLLGGGHYLRGGSAALTNRLVALIEEAGGVVEAGREASSLLLEGERVTGVAHQRRGGDGDSADFAPVVFGNAAPQILAGMLPAGQRDAFLAAYRRRTLSTSLWTVSLGLREPAASFGVAHYATFMLPAWMKNLGDFREAASVMGDVRGARLPPYAFVDYRKVGGTSDTEGPAVCSLVGVDRLENWASLSDSERQERKQRWMDRLIADLEREFPGIAGAVMHREMATAATMQRFLNTPDGAVYGFAPEGPATEVLRFAPATTIEGLYLASAFTFGGGFSGAMLGGAAAARAALRAGS